VSNPYLNPDEDSDILNSHGDKKQVRRQYSSYQGRLDADLPDDLKEAITSYISNDGEFDVDDIEIIVDSLPVEFRAMSTMYDYYSNYTRFKPDGPVIYAMAEILDEITDGRLSALADLRETERLIFSCHSLLRFMNLYLSWINPEEHRHYQNELFIYVDTFQNLLNYVLEKTIEQYRQHCKFLDKPVDEGLVESGVYTTRTRWCRDSMGRPTARGDV
jgi:hypothetical protein